MRSAPTSQGFSYRIGMPELLAGSTTSAFAAKERSAIETIVGVIGGTTEPMMIPRTCTRSIRLRENKPSTSSPSSSEVRSRSVCSRQLSTSVLPSNTPRTMLVLPTSMASSIWTTLFPDDFARDDPLDAIADPRQQRAVGVDARRDRLDRPGAAHPGDACAGRVRRARAPRVENTIESGGEQVVVAARQRRERCPQHSLAIGGHAEFRFDG